MASLVLRAPRRSSAPKLRLRRSPGDGRPVLVAGRDPAQRAAVLDELTHTMPPSTIFEQVSEFWEVLVRAPASRLVILSGDLDEVPVDSLMHMLGHRYPGLPVVTLGASVSASL